MFLIYIGTILIIFGIGLSILGIEKEFNCRVILPKGKIIEVENLKFHPSPIDNEGKEIFKEGVPVLILQDKKER